VTPRGFARQWSDDSKDDGFSLIELLVVLAFIGTLMLIALPALGTLLRASEVRGAAVSISQGMRTAQALALSDQPGQTPHNYILVVAPNNGTSAPLFCWTHPEADRNGPSGRRLWAVVEDVDGDCTIGVSDAVACESSDAVLRGWSPEVADDIQFACAGSCPEAIDIGGPDSNTAGTICFTPRGYVSRETEVGTGVYVGARFRELYHKVDVSLAGRIKTRRWDGTNYVD